VPVRFDPTLLKDLLVRRGVSKAGLNFLHRKFDPRKR